MPPRPDPRAEIRLLALRSLRGANYWSRWPVARLDLAVGAYDEISTAEVPGLPEALARALPGLVEHRCSVGERGGFLQRLHRGTYAPHVVEHLALELQAMAGHDVGYGRARGGDRPGEYTVVLEHRHELVGLRAAALALELARDAFGGVPLRVETAVAELRALAATPDAPPLKHTVGFALTGSGALAELARELGEEGSPAVPVSPDYLLHAGLPFGRAGAAVVLGTRPDDLPERYREPDRAARLLAVVADALERGGVVVAPAGAAALHDEVRRSRRRLALYAVAGQPPPLPDEAEGVVATAAARAGRIALRHRGGEADGGPLRDGVDRDVQLAAALARLAPTDLDPRPEA